MADNEDLKKELQDGLEKLKSDFSTASKEDKKAADEQIKGLESKIEELDGMVSKEDVEEMKVEFEAVTAELKEAIEKQSLTLAKQEGLISSSDRRTWTEKLDVAVKNGLDTPEVKEFLENAKKGSKNGSMSIELKDVSLGGDYSGTTQMSAAIASGVVVNEPGTLLARKNFFHKMIPSGSTGGEAVVHFDRFYDWQDAAIMRSENGALTENQFKIQEKSEDAKRIGSETIISNRMLKSIDYVRSRVMTTMPARIAYRKDFQVLNGDGTNNNLQGYLNAANSRSFTAELETSLAAGQVASIQDNGGFVELTFTADQLIHKDYSVTIAASTSYNGTFKVSEFLGRRTIVLNTPFTTGESTAAWTVLAVHPLTDQIEDPNLKDVLSAAKLNLNFGEFLADTTVVNPYDLEILAARKDTTGNYIFNADKDMTVNGMPIMTSNAIPQGTALVIDMANASQLWTVDGLRLNIISSTDAGLSRTNRTSFQMQEELIHSIYNPLLVLRVDIAAAITALTKP
mgnify:FL=1